MNVGMRVDRAIARMMATQYNTRARRKVFEMEDFSPFDFKPEPEAEEGSIEQAFGMLKAVARHSE